VDDNLLDLLRPAGEPVPRPPASYLKAYELGFDPPFAPANLAGEVHRTALEPKAVVFANRLDAAAEIDTLRARGRGEQFGERRLERGALLECPEDVLVRRGMELAQQWQDLRANESPRGLEIRAVGPVGQAVGA